MSFRELHRAGDPFVLMNVWDVGSARVAAALGARAIGTSSAAHAFTLGRADMGGVTRDEALAHAEGMVAATSLPVSADFENGFARDPEGVAESVRLAASTGLAGLSIEDTDLPETGPYEFDLAVERIEAAVGAARSAAGDLVVLARADGVLNGTYDVDEGIRRLQAFERVGADAVYLPGPPGVDALCRICASVSAPVNALAAGPFTSLTRNDFAQL
ncbi:MAG: isocitrate lyase/phosphoenolpyruvate mutase family protein, partial [Actinomycetota bacterium]